MISALAHRFAFSGPVWAPADVAAPPAVATRPRVSPITQRRIRNFAASKRGVWSLGLCVVMFGR